MLEREWLDNVTHVVTHANCPDGAASAILLHDALEGAQISFLTYGPELDKLEAKPGMLFCDLTPPAVRVKEFVDAGAIVLDHHAKQREIVEAFGLRGVFADLKDEPGVSGAMLAFREVWKWTTTEGSTSHHRAHLFAHLAGIRDTWQTEHALWKAAREQAEALRFYPWPHFAAVRNPFQGGFNDLTALLNVGPILVERADNAVVYAVERAVGKRTEKGTHVMIVATTHTSDIAEAVQDVCDVVIGFEYMGGDNGEIVLQLSMRSRGEYDVGAFCKSLGGGGHVSAAGARVRVHKDDYNPYVVIWNLVDAWEARADRSEYPF